MNEPKVSIILPIHNSINYTLEFLQSLYKVKYSNFELIVIDDGSTDGSFEKISKLYPEITILKGDGDYWWTKSINTGIKQALVNNPDYILTINNDLIVDTNIINELVICAEQNPKSIVGSIVFDKANRNKLFISGGKIRWIFPEHFRFNPLHKKNNDEPFNVDFLTGMGCLIPAKLFNDVGFYNDEHLPQYFADAELTLRAKKAGYQLLFCPKAKLWNDLESRTWKFPKKFNIENIKYLLFHKGSNYYLKATKYMYFKYWPFPLSFIAFSLLYLKCFTGLLLVGIPGGSKIINLFRKK